MPLHTNMSYEIYDNQAYIELTAIARHGLKGDDAEEAARKLQGISNEIVGSVNEQGYFTPDAIDNFIFERIQVLVSETKKRINEYVSLSSPNIANLRENRCAAMADQYGLTNETKLRTPSFLKELSLGCDKLDGMIKQEQRNKCVSLNSQAKFSQKVSAAPAGSVAAAPASPAKTR